MNVRDLIAELQRHDATLPVRVAIVRVDDTEQIDIADLHRENGWNPCVLISPYDE